jgi:hypothetical protein
MSSREAAPAGRWARCLCEEHSFSRLVAAIARAHTFPALSGSRDSYLDARPHPDRIPTSQPPTLGPRPARHAAEEPWGGYSDARGALGPGTSVSFPKAERAQVSDADSESRPGPGAYNLRKDLAEEFVDALWLRAGAPALRPPVSHVSCGPLRRLVSSSVGYTALVVAS